MRTGDTVTDLGLYTNECCSGETILDTGDTFPKCPACNHLCVWELEEELQIADELERVDQIAA